MPTGRVDGHRPGDIDIQLFNPVVDRDGDRWGQKDGVGLSVCSSSEADSVFTWLDIVMSRDALPPPYCIRRGWYTYPDVVNVPLVDAAGKPAAQFVELGPIDETP